MMIDRCHIFRFNMVPRPKRRFALVYMQDPASADDEFVGAAEHQGVLAEGQIKRVKRPSWPECKGRVLRIGKSFAELIC